MTAFPHRYELYGLTLHANRAIAGLSPARAETSNIVTIDFAGALADRPTATPFLSGGIETLWHLGEDRWHIEYSAPEKHYVWTISYSTDSMIVRWNHDAILDDVTPILQGSAISATLHLRGVPLLHACVLAVDDFAIAVMGVPGAGKSTTAAAFVAAGYALLSDDVAALDLTAPGVRVQSGYPRMRLYRDSARAAGFAEEALQRVFQEPLLGDKTFVELPPKSFREGPLPLRAIYILQPREPRSRETTITAMDARAAVPALMANVYSIRFLDRRRLENALANCVRIASAAAVRTVHAADDLEMLPALVSAMAADARNLR